MVTGLNASSIARSLVKSRIFGEICITIASAARAPRMVEARTVVIAAPGDGNIGDQAMLEAIIRRTSSVHVIGSGRTPESRFSDSISEPPTTQLRDLLYSSNPIKQLRAWRSLGRRVAGVRHIVVVGADIMDGHYNELASIMRLRAARLGTRAGAGARVLGFSWNGSVNATVLREAVAASRAGVSFLPRDPHSASRLESEGIGFEKVVADVVFTDTSKSNKLAAQLRHTQLQARPWAVVNVSGLIASRNPRHLQDMGSVVRYLTQAGFGVIILPHVWRSEGGDNDATRELGQNFASDPNVMVIDRLSTPTEVRGVVAEAELVVTGRMHLAIQALAQGTPAITLATQGKVSGLYEMLSLPELAVDPDSGGENSLLNALRWLSDHQSEVEHALELHMPEVAARAEGNFDGAWAELR